MSSHSPCICFFPSFSPHLLTVICPSCPSLSSPALLHQSSILCLSLLITSHFQHPLNRLPPLPWLSLGLPGLPLLRSHDWCSSWVWCSGCISCRGLQVMLQQGTVTVSHVTVQSTYQESPAWQRWKRLSTGGLHLVSYIFVCNVIGWEGFSEVSANVGCPPILQN